MKSKEIRQSFLDFFATRGHTPVASSSLIPGSDPTLLFTNAGMVQFKNVFLGRESRPYVRAASSQRCLRAGGKHNDLENVGYTARHHTFFEMLGNFSFGNYFKREAIHYAWDYLTGVLKLPKEKLWVTVYAEDREAAEIWLNEIGIPHDRLTPIATSDNFWQMGDTGPCGPCSEIFYDHGPEVAGGPPGTPDADGDRYIEIWNLVFMQYNRDEQGILHPLPKPSVDTGMGLERISAVMQGVHSNYDTDLFQILIKASAAATGVNDLGLNSLKVIADHIRACSFMIADGIIPSNEGRGYVLRRIARRGIRHGYKLGQKTPFFYKLVAALIEAMGEAYPELISGREHIEQVILQEEKRFAETLDHGMAILEAALEANPNELAGETVFKLYDTYGFPFDLTADIARERDVQLDQAGFDVAMEQQRARARSASHFTMQGTLNYSGPTTEFKGYDSLQLESRITAIYKNGEAVDRVRTGDHAVVILERTPFYAESGGQIGDQGLISAMANQFRVENTQKVRADVFGHDGVILHGELRVHDFVHSAVNSEQRSKTALNHSATHLLHAALRQTLGTHVNQKGSHVDADRLRFDFSHSGAVTREQIVEVERLVNEQIRHNLSVECRQMAYDQALKQGAMALFDEKYGDMVRVVSMGAYSVELCGGTHINRTGDIGLFKIISESGVAAGVRRIEAITGENAMRYLQFQEARLLHLAESLKTHVDEIPRRIESLLEQNRHAERELEQLKAKLALMSINDLVHKAIKVQDVSVLVARLDAFDNKALRESLDNIKARMHPSVVLFASVQEDNKVSLVAGVTKDITDKIKAGELVNMVAQQVGGKGGGRSDMAQAGGTKPEQLDQALASVLPWVTNKLG